MRTRWLRRRLARFMLSPAVLFLAPFMGGASGLFIEPHLYETRSHGEVEAELGKVGVPENRSRPDSREIELAFVRLASTAEQPGPPIVGEGRIRLTTAPAMLCDFRIGPFEQRSVEFIGA